MHHLCTFLQCSKGPEGRLPYLVAVIDDALAEVLCMAAASGNRLQVDALIAILRGASLTHIIWVRTDWQRCFAETGEHLLGESSSGVPRPAK